MVETLLFDLIGSTCNFTPVVSNYIKLLNKIVLYRVTLKVIFMIDFVYFFKLVMKSSV